MNLTTDKKGQFAPCNFYIYLQYIVQRHEDLFIIFCSHFYLETKMSFKQCCWSGFSGVNGSRSRSRKGKNNTQKLKKLINLIFLRAGCSLLRAEGLEVLEISKLQSLIQKERKIFLLYFFNCGHQNLGSGSGFTWNAWSTTLPINRHLIGKHREVTCILLAMVSLRGEAGIEGGFPPASWP